LENKKSALQRVEIVSRQEGMAGERKKRTSRLGESGGTTRTKYQVGKGGSSTLRSDSHQSTKRAPSKKNTT